MHGLPVSCPFNFPNGNLKQQLSHIEVFICYQNIDAKNKLNLHIYGIHLLNPHKTVVSHLKPTILPFSSNHLNVSQIKLNHVELEKIFDCLYFDTNDHYLIKTEKLLTKATTATPFFLGKKQKQVKSSIMTDRF